MKRNCGLCTIPVTGVRLCNPCIRYLNRLSNEDFAEVAVRSFGKTRSEADAWLKAQAAGLEER